jgi:hypothetical protein
MLNVLIFLIFDIKEKPSILELGVRFTVLNAFFD